MKTMRLITPSSLKKSSLLLNSITGIATKLIINGPHNIHITGNVNKKNISTVSRQHSQTHAGQQGAQ